MSETTSNSITEFSVILPRETATHLAEVSKALGHLETGELLGELIESMWISHCKPLNDAPTRTKPPMVMLHKHYDTRLH